MINGAFNFSNKMVAKFVYYYTSTALELIRGKKENNTIVGRMPDIRNYDVQYSVEGISYSGIF
jgi:hypothetical protein